MKIINGLIIALSITQTLSANEFKLDVGNQQTVLAGDIIDLNGKVLSGDKSKIDHYQWEENGKVLKNTAEDEIIYWDEENAENGYAPKGQGTHILKFVVVEESGKKHVKRLVVEVDKKDNVHINERKDMTFDLRPEFEVKTEAASWNSYHAIDGHYVDVKVGEIVPLSGIVSSSKKHLVDFYSWESKKGTILKNQLNDEIQYWDEENRENDYVPQKIGNEFLHFVVTEIDGTRHSKTLLLKVTSKDINEDDHGNTMATATEIALNKKVDALFETKGDHDFFKFTIDKKQNVKVVFNQSGTRKVKVLDSEGKAMPIEYSSVLGSSLYRAKPTVFETGTYYVDASRDFGKYTLEVQAYDINPIDEYPESPATEVFPRTIIKSYINSREDVDCFYMNKNNMKTPVIKFEKEGTVVAEVKNKNKVCLKLPFSAYGRFSYTITFPKVEVEDDHGNSKEEATQIEVNKIVNGKRNYTNDIDFFSFTLDKKMYVELSNRGADRNEKLITSTHLYTSDLKSINTFKREDKTFVSIKVLLEAGTYYIKVSNLYTNDYRLEVKTEEAP